MILNNAKTLIIICIHFNYFLFMNINRNTIISHIICSFYDSVICFFTELKQSFGTTEFSGFITKIDYAGALVPILFNTFFN